MIKTIGFFGDSFAADEYNTHSMLHGYETYIRKLKNHYGARVVNLGYGGSSIWDTYMIQLDPYIKAHRFPDVCVFVWTTPGRLFHRDIRKITVGNALYPKIHTYNIFKHEIWKAAKDYYLHLHDWGKSELEHEAFIYYLDNVLLKQIPKTTKIINLWTASKTSGWDNGNFSPSNIEYPFSFKTGVEIRPALVSLSLDKHSQDILQVDRRPNHIEGEEKNQMIASWIIEAIDNYADGLCLDYSSDVAKLSS